MYAIRSYYVILYFNRNEGVSLVGFFALNLREGNLSALLSVSVLPNLILFYFMVNRENWSAVRGILLGTIVYAIPVFLFKQW